MTKCCLFDPMTPKAFKKQDVRDIFYVLFLYRVNLNEGKKLTYLKIEIASRMVFSIAS